MSLIECSINSQLRELTNITKNVWNFIHNVDYGGVIIQPNGITVRYKTLNEALQILSDTLIVVKTGDVKWCLD
jgi:hypothetical protein